jgi:hypothetical protein
LLHQRRLSGVGAAQIINNDRRAISLGLLDRAAGVSGGMPPCQA